jgi:hypothetical protein
MKNKLGRPATIDLTRAQVVRATSLCLKAIDLGKTRTWIAGVIGGQAIDVTKLMRGEKISSVLIDKILKLLPMELKNGR